MVLTPMWVVRLSASLGILGGAFLFSGVSVLTNSFGQSYPRGEGQDKTSGNIFLAIGCKFFFSIDSPARDEWNI